MTEQLFGPGPHKAVMYYEKDHHSPFRGPALVMLVPVVKTTPTQIVILAPRGKGELRFRREDGHLVGGKYNSDRIAPKNEKSNKDFYESKLRRRVHAALNTLSEATRKLERIDRQPIEVLVELDPKLSLIRTELMLALVIAGKAAEAHKLIEDE